VKTLGKLDYIIDNQPVTTHDLLLQKSNGNFVLVLWGERFASGESDDITVHLAKRYESAKIHDITSGVLPVKEMKSGAIALSLTNYPAIVEFKF
jgi:hypothetical protein